MLLNILGFWTKLPVMCFSFNYCLYFQIYAAVCLERVRTLIKPRAISKLTQNNYAAIKRRSGSVYGPSRRPSPLETSIRFISEPFASNADMQLEPRDVLQAICGGCFNWGGGVTASERRLGRCDPEWILLVGYYDAGVVWYLGRFGNVWTYKKLEEDVLVLLFAHKIMMSLNFCFLRLYNFCIIKK